MRINPNYLELAVLLGCDDPDKMKRIKKEILSHIAKNKMNNEEIDDDSMLQYAIKAVQEYESRIAKEPDLKVDMSQLDTRNICRRDMRIIIYFGHNSYYLSECLFNPLLYEFDTSDLGKVMVV